jgi:hypothetical protein
MLSLAAARIDHRCNPEGFSTLAAQSDRLRLRRYDVKHYILAADRQVIEVDLLSWGRWREKGANPELARTEVGHLLVLTSFAGIDISFGDGPPAFFETRVLDGFDELDCSESASWHEALDRHAVLTERWSGWAKNVRDAARRALAEH